MSFSLIAALALVAGPAPGDDAGPLVTVHDRAVFSPSPELGRHHEAWGAIPRTRVDRPDRAPG